MIDSIESFSLLFVIYKLHGIKTLEAKAQCWYLQIKEFGKVKSWWSNSGRN